MGYPSNFTIYDTDDAKSVIRDIVKGMGLDDKHYKANFVYNRISAAKNSLLSPAEYKMDSHIQQEDARSNRPALGEIYSYYADRCFPQWCHGF